MALINPELIALARLNVVSDLELKSFKVSYEYSNGFDSIRVKGAGRRTPPIFVDDRPNVGDVAVVIFLTEPTQPGVVLNQGGIKATFDVVNVASPSDPSPLVFGISEPFSGVIGWQYADYSLSGVPSLGIPSSPYAKVNPQKALRFAPYLAEVAYKIDVSVFRNVGTLYK